jgi:hypothetical protein
MAKLPIALVAASLAIASSTVGAPAALAASPAHASIVRHGTAANARVYGRAGAPPARATEPYDRNPFTDMLLG